MRTLLNNQEANKLTQCSIILLTKIVACFIKKFLAVFNPEDVSTYRQHPTTFLYLDLDESSPQLQTIFLKD